MASVQSFVDALRAVMGSEDPFVLHAASVAEDAMQAKQLEVALNRTLTLPQAPVSGSLKTLWEKLRAFAMDASKQEEVVRDFKATTTHVMAEQFGLGHVSANGAVRVFKKPSVKEKKPPAGDDPNWDAEHRLYFDTIKRFLANETLATFNFPSYLTSEQREKVHRIAGLFPELDHDTFGSKKQGERFVRITKVDPLKRRRADLMLTAMLPDLSHPEPAWSSEGCVTPVVGDNQVRVVTFNVRWLDLALDEDVERCKSLAALILHLAPTVLCIQEGPSSAQRMAMFVAAHLNDAYEVHGGLEELRQQIFVLVVRDGPIVDLSLFDPAEQFLSQPFQFDLNGDRVLLEYKFVRRPVAVRGVMRSTGRPIFILGVHMKSMKVANGEQLCRTDLDKFIERSIQNRRRIGSECFHVRQCLEEVVFTQPGDPYVVVAGDVNCGSGRDFFARFFLLFDVIDVLQGSPFDKTKKLFSPLIDSSLVKPEHCWSALFKDCIDGLDKHVLVDHIFVNRTAKRSVVHGGIAHDLFAAHSSPSDHRPVFIDLAVD